MQTEVLERVGSVVSDVMERFAYVFGEPVEKHTLPVPSEELWLTSIRWSGTNAGSMKMAAPAALGSVLAANLLGIESDEEGAQERAADAFKEMLNVICGHLCTELGREGGFFDLDTPDLSPFTAAQWAALSGEEDCVTFAVDDHPLLLRFAWEDRAA